MPFTRGIGLPELLIVLVIIMIVFGVGKLPQVGNALGKGIREFRKAQNDEEGTDKAAEGQKESQKQESV